MYFHKYNHVHAYVYLYTCYYFTLRIIIIMCLWIYTSIILFVQILMSVVKEQMFVPKHVQTLLEASFVDVVVVIYWTLMGLLVMVSTNMCTIMIINLHIHIHTNINAYLHAYLLAKHINKYICICMYVYILKYSYITVT